MTELTVAPSEDAQRLGWTNELLTERLAELELQLDSDGWINLTGGLDRELSRAKLTEINHLARMYWLKNPLIKRGVNVQAYYVFGQGMEVSAADPEIDEVIQRFWGDAKNQAELCSQQALQLKETELTLFGNLFFVFFVNSKTGRVRVRTIPVDEIQDIVTNPEDSKDPWWYRREYKVRSVDGTDHAKTVYYKDWRYHGKEQPRGEISPDSVYHVKVGGLADMKFGVSEVYAALDWAKAYKSFLEDWSTIVRAYSRFAWQVTTKTKAGMVAAKAKLGTSASGTTTDTNPAPVTGSTFIGTEGVSVNPIRTAGATTSAEDGRRLLLMVASSDGLPESFYGDVSVGTLATARSLDRPTELKFVSRQSLWRDVFQAILRYVVTQSVLANMVKGKVIPDDDGEPEIELPPAPDERTGEVEERDLTINVDFPPVLEHDQLKGVQAIVQAATLGGSAQAGLINPETITRMLLTTLGVQDVNAIMDIVYPPDEEGEEPTTDEQPPATDEQPDDEPPPDVPETEALMVEAVRELRQAIADALRE